MSSYKNYVVHLSPSQQTCKPYKHPMTDVCLPQLSDAELKTALEQHLLGDSAARNTLILHNIALLRHTVGRYLYHWPLTHRFKDEMVSEGLVGIIEAIDSLDEKKARPENFSSHLISRICQKIEVELSKLIGIVPAPHRTNQRRVKEGLEPIYGLVVSDLARPEAQLVDSFVDELLMELEVFEIVGIIKKESQQMTELLDQKYWGKSDSEISRTLGISVNTIARHRRELLKRYLEKSEKGDS